MNKYIKLSFAVLLSLAITGCSTIEVVEEEDLGKEEQVNDAEKDDSVNEDISTEEKEDKEAENAEANETAEQAYQRILEDYSAQIREATPGLVDEYTNEVKDNTRGVEGLADLSAEKISVLAELNSDGVQEMAEVMMKKGSGSYDEYEDWAMKLMDVYMESAGELTDAYMGSATK